MRLETRLGCIESSPRASRACQDGAWEFAIRRSRLAGKLSRVAEKLTGRFGRYGRSSLRVHWDFTEGTGKIARNTPGDRRRRIVRLIVRNAGGCQIMTVRSLSLVVMYDCNP
ncbi:hypothetical protein BHM03_00046713 [Ensete ventricosum]|nr:hypothetical protein BHM03_00046713 [Ensete ventricosum]